MKSVIEREPVAVITALTALFQAGITLAVAFGLSLTADQIAALTAFLVAAGAVIQVLFVRQKVTPVADPRNNEGERLVAVSAERGATSGGAGPISPPQPAG